MNPLGLETGALNSNVTETPSGSGYYDGGLVRNSSNSSQPMPNVSQHIAPTALHLQPALPASRQHIPTSPVALPHQANNSNIAYDGRNSWPQSHYNYSGYNNTFIVPTYMQNHSTRQPSFTHQRNHATQNIFNMHAPNRRHHNAPWSPPRMLHHQQRHHNVNNNNVANNYNGGQVEVIDVDDVEKNSQQERYDCASTPTAANLSQQEQQQQENVEAKKSEPATTVEQPTLHKAYFETFAVVNIPPECKAGDIIKVAVPENSAITALSAGEQQQPRRVFGVVVPPDIITDIPKNNRYILVNTSVNRRPRLSVDSFSQYPAYLSSRMSPNRKSPQVVARRRPLHRAVAADGWKKDRNKYPQKVSNVGKKYQVSHIPELRKNEYQHGTNHSCGTLYDLVYDPKCPPEVIPPVLQKSLPETHLKDWKGSQPARFHVLMVRTMKNLSSVCKLMGNIGISRCLDYYYGAYKQTSQYASLKQTCPKHFEEDVLCGICKKPGAIIACDDCTDAYHFECLTPPLAEMPSADHFECTICIQDKTQTAARNQNNISTAGDSATPLKKNGGADANTPGILHSHSHGHSATLWKKNDSKASSTNQASPSRSTAEENSSSIFSSASSNAESMFELTQSGPDGEIMHHVNLATEEYNGITSNEQTELSKSLLRQSKRARRQSYKASELNKSPSGNPDASSLLSTSPHNGRTSQDKTQKSQKSDHSILGAPTTEAPLSTPASTVPHDKKRSQDNSRKSRKSDLSSLIVSTLTPVSAVPRDEKKSQGESRKLRKSDISSLSVSTGSLGSNIEMTRRAKLRLSREAQQCSSMGILIPNVEFNGIVSNTDMSKRNSSGSNCSMKSHESPMQLEHQIQLAKTGVPIFISAKTSSVYYESLNLAFPVKIHNAKNMGGPSNAVANSSITLVPWTVSVGDIVAVQIETMTGARKLASPFGIPWGVAQVIAMWREVSKEEASELRHVMQPKSSTKDNFDIDSKTINKEKISVEIRWFYRQPDVPDLEKLLGNSMIDKTSVGSPRTLASVALEEVYETDHIDICKLSCFVGSVEILFGRQPSRVPHAKRIVGVPTVTFLCEYFYFVVRKKVTKPPSFLGETHFNRAMNFSRIMKQCPTLKVLSLEWLKQHCDSWSDGSG